MSQPPQRRATGLTVERSARPKAPRAGGRGAPPRGTSGVALERASWERIMRRLRTLSGVLSAALVGLGVRMIAFGPALATAVISAIIFLLLVAAVLLTHQGRRLEP